MLNKDILEMYAGLESLMEDTEKKFPAKVSFAVLRNYKVLTPIMQDIMAAREAVAIKYGNLKGENYYIPPDKREIANKELLDIAEIDVEVSLIKIKMSDIENLNISFKEAKALEFMIGEE